MCGMLKGKICFYNYMEILNLKKISNINKNKTGLGLGIFIGKTLLEKNFASINCKNSKMKSGAEVSIRWNNKDLLKI